MDISFIVKICCCWHGGKIPDFHVNVWSLDLISKRHSRLVFETVLELAGPIGIVTC